MVEKKWNQIKTPQKHSQKADRLHENLDNPVTKPLSQFG